MITKILALPLLIMLLASSSCARSIAPCLYCYEPCVNCAVPCLYCAEPCPNCIEPSSWITHSGLELRLSRARYHAGFPVLVIYILNNTEYNITMPMSAMVTDIEKYLNGEWIRLKKHEGHGRTGFGFNTFLPNERIEFALQTWLVAYEPLSTGFYRIVNMFDATSTLHYVHDDYTYFELIDELPFYFQLEFEVYCNRLE